MAPLAPFTLDDLTLNEYAILARKIKGDPLWALTSPDSLKGAEALAGLCWLHDRREQAGVAFEDYLTWSPKQAREHLGHTAALEAAAHVDPADDEDAGDVDEGERQTVLEAATAGASEVAGSLVDPTTPPSSPCSPT